MESEELRQTFDQQASSYDQKWSRLAAFRDSLHLLLGSIFRDLSSDARILCVGSGTGAEILYLAERFPGWSFTAVEPSAGMLNIFRQHAERSGIAARCTFHEGYIESLSQSQPFDAATCFLVSQFILDKAARANFFRAIAEHVRPGGLLASSDLSGNDNSDTYQSLLNVWLRTIAAPDASPEAIEQMCTAYRRDVAALPEREVEEIITAGGFESPTQFLQTGLIHAWYSRRVAA